MNQTSLYTAIIGGVLIGLAAVLLLLFNGRIAGISGILSGLSPLRWRETAWRWLFVAGLLAGGLTLQIYQPEAFGQPAASPLKLALAGVLVGVGTRISNGCTSGHGVCGLSQRSLRSLVATLVFMGTAIAVVYVSNHVLASQ